MSLPDTDHVPLPPGKALAHPLASAMVVVYATLILLALTVPRGLANWARDMDPGAAQQAVLAGADAIARLSGAIAIDKPYAWARGIFLSGTGKRED
jgi:hypothetical protein